MTGSDVSENHGRPVWQVNADSTCCTKCSRPFTLIYRRHHCRACGKLVCDGCSPHRADLPSSYGYPTGKHRTCTTCYSTLLAMNYEKNLSAGAIQPPNYTSIMASLLERAHKYSRLSPDGWASKREMDGVHVSTRPIDGHQIDCVQSEVMIRAPMRKVVGVYQNMELWTKWNSHMQSRIVEIVGGGAKVVSASYQFPVIDRRDSCFFTAVVEGDLSGDQQPSSLMTAAMSMEHPLCPPEAGVVRAEMLISVTKLEPVGDGQTTKLTSIVHSDPRGLLPPWLVNRVLARGAQHLRGMADYIESTHRPE